MIKSQLEILDLLKSKTLQKYNKIAIVNFRIVSETEEVVTNINGETETRNTANPGDYVLTNPGGECYVVNPNKFAERYVSIFETNIAVPKGSCWAFKYEGESFKFVSPWLEEMICNDGDMLASPNTELTEVYRIARAEFEATYKIEK